MWIHALISISGGNGGTEQWIREPKNWDWRRENAMNLRILLGVLYEKLRCWCLSLALSLFFYKSVWCCLWVYFLAIWSIAKATSLRYGFNYTGIFILVARERVYKEQKSYGSNNTVRWSELKGNLGTSENGTHVLIWLAQRLQKSDFISFNRPSIFFFFLHFFFLRFVSIRRW